MELKVLYLYTSLAPYKWHNFDEIIFSLKPLVLVYEMRIIVSALQGKLNKDVFWIAQDFSFCQLNIFIFNKHFYILH